METAQIVETAVVLAEKERIAVETTAGNAKTTGKTMTADADRIPAWIPDLLSLTRDREHADAKLPRTIIKAD